MKDRKIEELREVALFSACRPRDIEWIARVADTVDIPAERALVTEGTRVREFIVLVRGNADAIDGDESVTLTPGAYFGEAGLVDNEPHRRTVVTRTPARLLVFGPGAFRGMLDRIPAVGRKLLAGKVSELRVADQRSRRLQAVS